MRPAVFVVLSIIGVSPALLTPPTPILTTAFVRTVSSCHVT